MLPTLLRRPTVVVGGAAALVVVVLGVALRGQVGDTRLDLLLGTPVVEAFVGHRDAAVALADVGGPASVALLAAALAASLAVRRRWVDAAVVLLAPAAAGLLTQLVLKPLVDRPLAGAPAWPSGHASGTWALAAVAVVLLLRDGATRARRVDAAAVVAVAVAGGVGLVAAQYHFATDVVGGAALGVAVACALTAVAGRVRRDQ